MTTRSTIRTFAFLAATVIALACPLQSQTAKGGTARPFKGSAEGSFVGPLEIHATGRASHLGKFTRTEVLSIDPTNGSISGSMVFTAANGDELRANVAGSFTGPGTAAGTYTITGGSGRFTGATGTATFNASTPDFVNVQIRFEGTINY